MKVYFICPYNNNFNLYWQEMPDDTEIDKVEFIKVGYNDSYEMRSEKIGKNCFSTDPASLELKLKERKEQMIKMVYAKVIGEYRKALETKTGDINSAIERRGIDCPW
jgi:hypothetical protein